MPAPRIDTVVLGEFLTNCFVVTVPAPAPAAGGSEPTACWIVDCGFEPEPLFEVIDRRRLRPAAILLTHSHPDHIAGVDEALRRYGPLPVYLHAAERGFCSDPLLNLSAAMGMRVTCAEPDHWLSGGETLELGGEPWRVLHTPGHSPGGVVYLHEASGQAIVGDTLFAGSIGRIDFPSSDPAAMRRTIHETLMGLPDETMIYPGHGPTTTIGRERATNPFVRGGF